MRFRPRFSLRTLFILIAATAAILAWRQSTLAWIAARHHAIGDSQAAIQNYAVRVLSLDPKCRNLPLSLRIWGETKCVYCLQSYSDAVQLKDHLVEFQQLFPEAKIEARTSAQWDKLTQENGGKMLVPRAPP